MYASLKAEQFFKRLDAIEYGCLTLTTPDGKTRHFAGKQPGENVDLTLHEWRVVMNIIRKGDIGFAEDYSAGLWETSDLVSLSTFALANRTALDEMILGSRLSRLLSQVSYLFRLNTLKGSRKNIHAHYDLGNEFYRLWLDPTMTYSAALYHTPQDSLETAQNNKYDRIIDVLDTDNGSLLEVGCGWGGFANRAVMKSNFDIKGITLSEEQHRYATEQLQQQAKINLEDYRHQTGKYDRIVSIEMFEAVGEKFWPTYFQKMASLLNSKGKAVVQTITINDDDFDRYRTGSDFIRSYIFPGGMLPSPARFEQEAQKAGLQTSNSYFFGHDYAQTLHEWLYVFDNKREQVINMGFDERFIRLWRFYLAACIAGFITNKTNVMQIELSHA